MKNKLLCNAGFSIIEVLIAIILLSVGVVSLMSTLGTSLFIDSEVSNNTKALYLAQDKMEEIKGATAYADIDTYAAVRANIGGNYSGFDREVTVSGDPKQVNVIVYWNAKADEQSITLVSLLADYGY